MVLCLNCRVKHPLNQTRIRVRHECMISCGFEPDDWNAAKRLVAKFRNDDQEAWEVKNDVPKMNLETASTGNVAKKELSRLFVNQ